jgi:ubiquinone/menaquinone biosynthesis C-methylase UbiE
MVTAHSSVETAPARFDRIASNYETSEVHKSSPSIDIVHRLSIIKSDARIADIACGAGHFGLSFAQRAATIAFCDASPNMLAAVKRQSAGITADLEFHQCFAEALPLDDGWADLTISRLASHHFADIAQAVCEMVRVTKRGGRIAIIDLEGFPDLSVDAFNHKLELLHDPTHVRSYQTSEWCAFFRQAGAQIEYVQGGMAESSDGVPIARWCQIASSGNEAEAAINTALAHADDKTLATMGIWPNGDSFRMPIRTMLLVASVL